MTQSEIESGRAEFALNAVKRIKDTENNKKYKSYAKKFPSLVLSNGLAATIAFALDKSNTKGGKAWGIINEDVTKWLKKKGYLPSDDKLEDYICSLDSDEYRIVTNEVLALFEWIRRFASGLIEGEDDE